MRKQFQLGKYMRKITVLSMITLDGVMQGPGGPGEDTSGGFKFGGWTASYDDELFGKIMAEELKPADYILGRKTFEIFASYWPQHADFWPGINDGTKHVLSRRKMTCLRYLPGPGEVDQRSTVYRGHWSP